jgi:hypothetical protein
MTLKERMEKEISVALSSGDEFEAEMGREPFTDQELVLWWISRHADTFNPEDSCQEAFPD